MRRIHFALNFACAAKPSESKGWLCFWSVPVLSSGFGSEDLQWLSSSNQSLNNICLPSAFWSNLDYFQLRSVLSLGVLHLMPRWCHSQYHHAVKSQSLWKRAPQKEQMDRKSPVTFPTVSAPFPSSEAGQCAVHVPASKACSAFLWILCTTDLYFGLAFKM